jgi:hypothetical protein
MCVTLGPAQLSKTILYAGEARHPGSGKYIHTLAYQNRAENKEGRPNAMAIPLPSKSLMSSANVVDLAEYKTLLQDLAKPIREMNLAASAGNRGLSAEVFDVGSYTVVLAKRPEDAVVAIGQLPPDKQPKLNREIFNAYAQWYPGWHIALCCWDGKIEPEPLLWWYEPLDPKTLFYPTLDAHNGRAPSLGRDVKRDHTLLVGSTIHPIGTDSRVKDLGPAAPYISDKVWGRVMEGSDWNRDFTTSVPFLRTLKNVQGRFDMHSRLDPNIWNLEFEYRHPERP